MLKKRQNGVKRNNFLFDEVKKHSRTSPEIQFKELNLNFVFYLTSRSIELCQPEHKQNRQRTNKNWETKRIKTKQIILFTFKNTYSKYMININFCFWNHSSIISARPEKMFISPWLKGNVFGRRAKNLNKTGFSKKNSQWRRRRHKYIQCYLYITPSIVMNCMYKLSLCTRLRKPTTQIS